jgi:hypothetical protein
MNVLDARAPASGVRQLATDRRYFCSCSMKRCPPRRGVSGKKRVVTTLAEGLSRDEPTGANGGSSFDEPSESQQSHPAFNDDDSGDDTSGGGKAGGLQRQKSAGILRQQSLYRPDPVTGLVPQKSGRRIVVVDPPAEDDDAHGESGRKGGAASGGCCGCFG